MDCAYCSAPLQDGGAWRACTAEGCRARGIAWYECLRCRTFTIPRLKVGGPRLCVSCATMGVPCGACGRLRALELPCCVAPECPAALAGVEPPPPGPWPGEGAAWAARQLEDLLDLFSERPGFEERYRVERPLFRGGMGEIWAAYDRLLGRTVAVKRLPLEVAALPLARAQFMKEARVGARLLHPNVLPVFDAGVDRERRPYFTTRLVDGGSFREALDAIPPGRLAGVVARAAAGVAHAHAHGVVHLDLKPENMLISKFDEVFVIDWGLAQVDGADDRSAMADLYRGAEHSLDATRAGGTRIVGTPGYMAPEQWNDAPATPLTDVFGLGGVLYFALHGTPPCRPRGVDDMLEVRRITLEAHRRTPFREGLPPDATLEALEAIALKALAREPADRHPSATAFAGELERISRR